MKKLISLVAILFWLSAIATAGELVAPKFTRKPEARKVDGKVRIEFAVDRKTDVSVFIEDANGRAVRHLVAGVLGNPSTGSGRGNPPKPLKPGLSQSIEWDGKADWGKPVPAGAGPFKVRVALGLGARYDRAIISDPNSIGGVLAMATAPDGTLYAVTSVGAKVANWRGQQLVALNRDGTFQRTVLPPPVNATREQIAALGGLPVEIGGRTVPAIINLRRRRHTAFWSNNGAAVTPDGKFLTLHPDTRMIMVDLTGAAKPPRCLGPKLLPKNSKASFRTIRQGQYLAVSGDGKHAYFSGIARSRSWSKKKVPPYPAVFRVKLPERSPAEPFFGDLVKTGNDKTHLGSHAHGMAADGKGNLLICDPLNKRVVVVSEKSGKFVGSFPADNPERVAVDRKSGAVYVLNVGKRAVANLVKLSGWKDPGTLASIRLKSPRSYLRWRMAVDTSATPAVLWASNGWEFFRVEEQGNKFGDARKLGGRYLGDGGFVNLSVDHFRADPEIYIRATQQRWMRFSEKTGKIDRIQGMNLYTVNAGSCLEPGPDGNLYIQGWPQFLYKFDRKGKPLKWGVPFVVPKGVKPYAKPPNAIYSKVCMVYMTHTHGIRSDGHHFMFEARKTRGPKALYEYDPSGKRVGGPIIWKVSDFAVGPRFDQAGNIYIAEQVRPLDQPIPPEFAKVVGPVTLKSRWGGDDPKRTIAIMYGSILKFSPKGGMVDWDGGKRTSRTNPFDGKPKLDPSLKTVKMAAIVQTSDNTNAFCGAKVTGAEWVHFGISQLPQFYCNCESTRFDVDLFGRVWYPDMGRYQVGVLDTNGNMITTFGGYGNAESRGPDSPVVDPKTGKVRPRKADDPKDLKSPFAEPEIAFSYLIGVGATARYVYMADSLNRRLLRARLVYAAEQTCPIP
jgi:hypothetical protein